MPYPDRPSKVPVLNLNSIPEYITSSDEGEENNANESSIFNMKKSQDGSKLIRQSEINSENSLSFTNKDVSKNFKEFLLNDEVKINKYIGKSHIQNDLLEEVHLDMAVSQSLNTDNINFNM